MNNQLQPSQQINTQPTQNKFQGKKIENNLTFNIASQIKIAQNDTNEIQSSIVQIHSNKVQATPINYAIPQKKIPQKLVQNQAVLINQSVDKAKPKNKSNLKSQENKNSMQQISQQNLKNLIQEQQRLKKEDVQTEGNQKNIIPISFSERRQQKKLAQIQNENALAKKDISIIQQATNISNLSSDCEEFVDIMMPKKNLKNIISSQQQILSQQQINLINNSEQNGQEKEQKKQIDVDEIIRKSNLKYKTDKEISEIHRQQKQSEMQKLKEKMKKQEEETRKRNQQKTQQFKEKKKRKEKEQQKQKQEQIQQQNDQQKRRKSYSKINQQQQQNPHPRHNTSQQNTSRDNIPNQKNEINREQFDLATKNRVKELMKKQKEEKERLEEEKEKKKLKLEILRQEQLIQLQKAKVKTIEQEEEERRQQMVKRPGGSSIAVPQYQDQRDTRQSLHYRMQQENNQNQQGQQHYDEYTQDNENNQEFEENDISLQKQNISYQDKHHIMQRKSINNKVFNNVRSQNNAGVKKNNTSQENTVSDSFLKENIRASIKQLYPGCTLEELIQLEQEYKREYGQEMKKQNKLNNFKQKQILKPSNIKSTSSKKNNINEFEKLKKKQQYETKEELQKLLELKKLDDFDINSVDNPIEMIENLKQLASQIQEDIDQNDRKYGIGKYKRQQKNTQSINNNQPSYNLNQNMKQESTLLEKEKYLQQLYENAQNTFSPEEMQEFEVYLQNHLINGEIILSDEEKEKYSDEEQSDEEESEYDEENQQDQDYNEGEYDDDENYQNQNNKIFEQPQLKNMNFRQKQQQKQSVPQQLTLNRKQQTQISQNKVQKNQVNHSQSVQCMNNQDSATKRGRSQDPKTPKSCLVKEQKQKRSKTVTFDQQYIQSEQKTRVQMSPQIHQQKDQYDFNEFDDFNERDVEGSDQMSQEYYTNQQINKQNYQKQDKQIINEQKFKLMYEAMKQQEEQRQKFEKKVQDVKELILQYSGDKKKSIDISNPISSLESSIGSNLRLSHLKTQNSTNQQTLNDASKQFSSNQQGIITNQKVTKNLETINEQNKQTLKVQQNQQQIENQKKSIINNLLHQNQNQQKQVTNQQQKIQNINQKIQIPQNQKINPSKENISTLNIPAPNIQQNNLKKNNEKKIEDSEPSPIIITQSSPQALSNIPTEFESDFLVFNEQFDIDKFKNQLTQDDLRQLIHVNNLDLKSFFTNEKLNYVQRIQGQQLGQQQKQNNNYQYEDADEGLFADDSPRQNKVGMVDEVSSSEKAFNYYEKNKDLLQSNDKNAQKQYNNYLLQEQTNQFQNNNNVMNENEYLSSYSEYNKEFLDDDKLFALSATDLLKLTETQTRQQK